MLYDFNSFALQFEFLMPIPGAFVVDIDWNTISESQGSFWDGNQGLNRLLTLKSVFEFHGNFQVL